MGTFRRVLIYLAAGSVIGLLTFSRRYFDALANDLQRSPWPVLLDEITAAWLAALLILGIVTLASRFPVRRYWWLYLLGAPIYAALHTLGMFTSRSLLYPAFGMGEYNYGALGYRFLMEAPPQLMGYALVIVVLVFIGRLRKAREAERLEGLLAQAQLERLRLSIGPHFLFNALNVISAAVYESPEKADELIGRLSRLLRALLARDVDQTCPLGEELELLGEYLALQQARFEDRLAVAIECADDLLEAEVPFMVLQPLVENALVHGRSADGRVDVTVRARREENMLALEVLDRGAGPGTSSHAAGEGIGTRNTRERLQRLYDQGASFQLLPRPDAGAVSRVRIPFRCAS